MNVLLSIKPEYVEKILSRRKKYEFRKQRPRIRTKTQKAYIYSTYPICKIVGSFNIRNIQQNHPKILWRKFGSRAGIDADQFSEYFGSRKVGFAIEISSLRTFDPPIEPKRAFDDFVAPQSFRYMLPAWEDSIIQ
jgi:predicted transcriptional regulator